MIIALLVTWVFFSRQPNDLAPEGELADQKKFHLHKRFILSLWIVKHHVLLK